MPQTFRLVSLLAACLPSLAHAYIPPSQFILKGVVAKHAGLKSLKLSFQVSELDAQGKPTSLRFKETLHATGSAGVLRSWAIGANSGVLYSAEKKGGSLTPIEALLFGAPLEEVAAVLRARGVAIKTESELAALGNEDERRAADATSMTRWQKSINWLIGPELPRGPAAQATALSDGEAPAATTAPADHAARLWVEKDTFLPRRLVYSESKSRAAETLVDARFDSYRFTHETPFPRAMAIDIGGKPRFQIELLEALVNVDPKQLKLPTAAQGGAERGFTDQVPASADDLRRAIQQYYDVLHG